MPFFNEHFRYFFAIGRKHKILSIPVALFEAFFQFASNAFQVVEQFDVGVALLKKRFVQVEVAVGKNNAIEAPVHAVHKATNSLANLPVFAVVEIVV